MEDSHKMSTLHYIPVWWNYTIYNKSHKEKKVWYK